ncbi:DUF5304 domain-containing protein [Streptomyces sp. URMC 123]|uniref:DUF5304 domain-containing protein n=1 Tax=Streptomyces sp. URMC 123 TaxID=3423403 RepID=UPI003F1ADDD4
MSEATERPLDDSVDADAWARACAEDLAAERDRRRGRPAGEPGSAADELRKLVDAVADKLSAFQAPLAGAVAQDAVRQFVDRAKAAVEPVIERNPQVFDHLAAAGTELMAAYRAAVTGSAAGTGAGSDAAAGAADTTGDAGAERRRGEGADGPSGPGPDERRDGPADSGRIDLD